MQSIDLCPTFEPMEALSYVALFASSFLAATVIPFSSEAVLAATLLAWIERSSDQ